MKRPYSAMADFEANPNPNNFIKKKKDAAPEMSEAAKKMMASLKNQNLKNYVFSFIIITPFY